jgi:hypothetical protein
MSSFERRLWLKGSLKVFPVERTFLIGFVAETESAQDAAEVANAAATAYYGLPRATSRQPLGGEKAGLEILKEAVPAIRPKPSSSPLGESLANALICAMPFLLGIGIGSGGFLVEKARRARIPSLT